MPSIMPTLAWAPQKFPLYIATQARNVPPQARYVRTCLFLTVRVIGETRYVHPRIVHLVDAQHLCNLLAQRSSFLTGCFLRYIRDNT